MLSQLQNREIGARNDVRSANVRAQQYAARVVRALIRSMRRFLELEAQGNVVAAYFPEPRFESRRVTLECQTLKMREKVRRSFVTDLAGFRHLFIRQPEGFVIRATGPDLAYHIGRGGGGARFRRGNILRFDCDELYWHLGRLSYNTKCYSREHTRCSSAPHASAA